MINSRYKARKNSHGAMILSQLDFNYSRDGCVHVSQCVCIVSTDDLALVFARNGTNVTMLRYLLVISK